MGGASEDGTGIDQAGITGSTRKVRLLEGVLVADEIGASAEAPTPDERSSPPGQVVVVAVNARQIFRHSSARLEQLAIALRKRPKASDGGYLAPDVILVNEVSATDLGFVRNRMNDLFSSNHYLIAGERSDEVKTKFLINAKSTSLISYRSWADSCVPHVRYQLVNVKERASDNLLTVGGVHFRADYRGSGGRECRNQNVDKARERLARQGARGVLLGDFNRRAMNKQRECDPEETSRVEPWYEDMTSASTVDGRSYLDAVREYNRANNLTMFNEWTHEQEDPSTRCDGTTGLRRNRIDYIFIDGTLTPLEAHADHPGWASGSQPGVIRCKPSPECKYSDHRFVWGRIGLA